MMQVSRPGAEVILLAVWNGVMSIVIWVMQLANWNEFMSLAVWP